MKRVKRWVLRALRRVAGRNRRVEELVRHGYRRVALRAQEGRDTRVERLIKAANMRVRGLRSHSFRSERFTVVWSDSPEGSPRMGIYAKGSCDLPSVFAAAHDIQDSIDGTCAVYLERGGGASVRSDILLQTLRPQSPELVEQVTRDLTLPPGYFSPTVFEKTFRLPGYGYMGEFPKNVVVLSMAADVVRTVYRHREGGLLVDPGGWWLNQDMGQVLASLDKVTWFREAFEKVGKISVDEFYVNFTEVIGTLKERTTPHVLVMNILEVEPGDPTHTYQLVPNPGTKRRREFNLALLDLSRELDFSIVDVDRIMKKRGVQSHVDFAHFSSDGFRPLADEIFGILEEREVFSR